ncbi:GNAT family N-acetyltransferase [Euzebya sp.]|uniref:GNAT family N-acetyltransferase n=1 Tax=Euzebya sp. TaxID=1971409 RepID=UPI0035139C02
MADRLTAHLRAWVGEWPPRATVQVVGDPARDRPTWDGSVRPLLGVGDGERHVIAVPPSAVDDVRRVIGTDLADPGLGDRLAPLLGMDGAVFGTGVFRWTHLPAPLPSTGTWVPTQDARLPSWLAPFNGPRLVAMDPRGGYLAGVGIKVHDPVGREIAVVTSPAARGKGLARRLVVTATRRILADGGVPTYLHDPANTASARVADAAGFHDRGWTVHGLWRRPAEGR